MKIIEALTTSILFLLPGAIAPAYALGQHEQEKQPEQKQQQARPAQHQQQARPAQQPQRAAQQKQAKPAQQSQPAAQRSAQHEQAKPAQQSQPAAQRSAQHEQAKQAQPAAQRSAQQKQAKPAQQRQGAQQANRAQSGGGRGSISEARFHSSFGHDHTFHVNRAEFAGGAGRFQYGGYWFNILDPWPAGWLYTDNVYVDYLNGGYFLCDPYHPGVYISINLG
jgi:hypothetical protein